MPHNIQPAKFEWQTVLERDEINIFSDRICRRMEIIIHGNSGRQKQKNKPITIAKLQMEALNQEQQYLVSMKDGITTETKIKYSKGKNHYLINEHGGGWHLQSELNLR